MIFPFRDNNPTYRYAVVNYAIITINVIVLLVMSNQSPLGFTETALRFGFVPARIEQFRNPQPLVIDLNEDPEVKKQLGGKVEKITLEADPWQIATTMVTHMFMHGGWLHLLSNMWYLFIFGNNIEDRLGHVAYLFFYLIGGLGAMACHYASDTASTAPVIGASGAVAAVLGAYMVTYPKARVRSLIFLIIFITIVDLPAFVVLGVWFLLQVSQAWQELAVPGMNMGVAWWAHIGGFLVGCLLMPLMALGAPPPGHGWHEEDDWLEN